MKTSRRESDVNHLTQKMSAACFGAVAAALLCARHGEAQDSAWSFDLTGRFQVVQNVIDADLPGYSDRWSDSDVRRVRIGIDGERGRFSFRAELEPDDELIAIWDDLWVEYDTGPMVVGVGQWKPPATLEFQSSSRYILAIERSSMVEAFGFARRLGFQVGARGDRFTFEAGLFGGNAANDLDATAEGSAAATRVTFNPVAGDDLTVHLGASAQHRKAQDGHLMRYRSRPRVSLSPRFVDTGAFADEDDFLGVEAGVFAGRLHLFGEYGGLSAQGPADDADLSGGYVEGGVFLTAGDRLGYGNGLIDRTRPTHPVGEGGLGAWQLRGRVDRIDLTDGAVAGGEQTSYSVGVNWFATDYVRFVTELTRADIEAGPDGSGEVDSASIRAAVDW